MKKIYLRVLALVLMIFFSVVPLTVAARDTYYYPVEDAVVYNFSEGYEKSTPVPQAKLLETWYTSPLSGQGAVLGFGFREDKSGSSRLPTFWAQKGKACYDYYYNNIKGELYRVLDLYSSEFPDACVEFIINDKYDGECVARIILSNDKCYDAEISNSNAKKLFLWVARKVRDLGFTKRRNDTLYIDVDF